MRLLPRFFPRRLLPPKYWARWWKRRLPTSLFGRTLLIIVLPVALMQLAVTWAFFDAHWQTVTSRLGASLAGDIAWIVDAYEDDPNPRNLAQVTERAQDAMSLSVALQPGRELPVNRGRSLFGALDRTLDDALEAGLDRPYWFDTTDYPAYVDIRVEVEGGALRILAPRDRATASRAPIFVLWLGGATLLLTAVSLAFIRNQVRAIERLAAAAEAFGKGADTAFKPHGAKEVRSAGLAFLEMRTRLQRHIDQRTALLASVSHDLRTPLTRLKLELALSPKGTRTEAMKRDIADMERMIEEYLAFARTAHEAASGEAPEPTPLADLLEDAASGARRLGAEVAVAVDGRLTASVRPLAFRRLIANLVGNAASHGERVQLSARERPGGGVEITVDDDGPGIPPERYEEAFLPFNRLDPSRNQNRDGVGLGLAIARDVARGHGGDVALDRSPLGGLRAVVKLPG